MPELPNDTRQVLAVQDEPVPLLCPTHAQAAAAWADDITPPLAHTFRDDGERHVETIRLRGGGYLEVHYMDGTPVDHRSERVCFYLDGNDVSFRPT
jgi:hypothetical protein